MAHGDVELIRFPTQIYMYFFFFSSGFNYFLVYCLSQVWYKDIQN